MKATSIVVLSALVLLNLSGNSKADPVGREPKCPTTVPRCPRISDPVCGTNGATFENECILCVYNKANNKHVLVAKTGRC